MLVTRHVLVLRRLTVINGPAEAKMLSTLRLPTAWMEGTSMPNTTATTTANTNERDIVMLVTWRERGERRGERERASVP